MSQGNDFFTVLSGFQQITNQAHQQQVNQINSKLLEQKLSFNEQTAPIRLRALEAETALFEQNLSNSQFVGKNQQSVFDLGQALTKQQLDSSKAQGEGFKFANSQAIRNADTVAAGLKANVDLLNAQTQRFVSENAILNAEEKRTIIAEHDKRSVILETRFNNAGSKNARQQLIAAGRAEVARSETAMPGVTLTLNQLQERQDSGTANADRPLALTSDELNARQIQDADKLLRKIAPEVADAKLLRQEAERSRTQQVMDILRAGGSFNDVEALSQAGFFSQGPVPNEKTANTNNRVSNSVNDIINQTLDSKLNNAFNLGPEDSGPVNPKKDKAKNLDRVRSIFDVEAKSATGKKIKPDFNVLSNSEFETVNPASFDSRVEKKVKILLNNDTNVFRKGSLKNKLIDQEFSNSRNRFKNKINQAKRRGSIPAEFVKDLKDFETKLVGRELKFTGGNSTEELFKTDSGIHSINLNSMPRKDKAILLNTLSLIFSAKNSAEREKIKLDLNSTNALTPKQAIILTAFLDQLKQMQSN